MAKILITGGSGLAGRATTRKLQQQGHEVVWLSRKAGSVDVVKCYEWNIEAGHIDAAAFHGVQHLIHLAGASIAGRRWTSKYKQQILASRVLSSELLYRHIRQHNVALKSFTGASAVGYYGALVSDHVFSEADKPGKDFLAQVCYAWEKSYEPIRQAGIRTCVIRTAVVLDRNEGALPKMMLPFRFGLGAALGSGDQGFPWIHIDDLASIYAKSCTDEKMEGVYNAAAPEHISNCAFSRALAGALHRPMWLPNVPAPVLKLLVGEVANSLLTGTKINSDRIRETGFEFSYRAARGALEKMLAK